MTLTVQNILRTFDRATPAQYAEGMDWYADTNALAVEIASGDVWKGAGVLSAFSPKCRWPRNVMLARNAFITGIATGSTSLFNSQAQRIMDGAHPLDVFAGPKQRAFCVAIADPENAMIATIDRHAFDIAMGRIHPENERNITRKVFRELSDAYVSAAEYACVSVAQMQAITWVAWREMHGIA